MFGAMFGTMVSISLAAFVDAMVGTSVGTLVGDSLSAMAIAMVNAMVSAMVSALVDSLHGAMSIISFRAMVGAKVVAVARVSLDTVVCTFAINILNTMVIAMMGANPWRGSFILELVGFGLPRGHLSSKFLMNSINFADGGPCACKRPFA